RRPAVAAEAAAHRGAAVGFRDAEARLAAQAERRRRNRDDRRVGAAARALAVAAMAVDGKNRRGGRFRTDRTARAATREGYVHPSWRTKRGAVNPALSVQLAHSQPSIGGVRASVFVASGGGNGDLNVNARAEGPRVASSSRRSFASSMVGR